MNHPSNTIQAGLPLLTGRISSRPFVAGRSLSSTKQRELPVQQLTLFLAGITADEYLTRVRNPEPQALGHQLKSVTARADPLGRRVEVELVWDQPPPALRDAAITAGFPLTPEVMGLRPTGL